MCEPGFNQLNNTKTSDIPAPNYVRLLTSVEEKCDSKISTQKDVRIRCVSLFSVFTETFTIRIVPSECVRVPRVSFAALVVRACPSVKVEKRGKGPPRARARAEQTARSQLFGER